MRSYPHLSQEEKTLISHYHDNGRFIREISRSLCRAASTISRELKRTSNSLDYKAQTATKRYFARRAHLCALDKEVALSAYVLDRLRGGISSELISIWLKNFGHLEGIAFVSHESLYQWLYKPPQKKQKLHKLLCQAHGTRGRRKRATRSPIKERASERG